MCTDISPLLLELGQLHRINVSTAALSMQWCGQPFCKDHEATTHFQIHTLECMFVTYMCTTSPSIISHITTEHAEKVLHARLRLHTSTCTCLNYCECGSYINCHTYWTFPNCLHVYYSLIVITTSGRVFNVVSIPIHVHVLFYLFN